MRTIFALLIFLFGLSCLAQVSPPFYRVPNPTVWPAPVPHRHSVDLSKPGAFDQLQESNPEHYSKVLEVRRVASQPSCVEDLKVLRARLDLDDATCAAMTTLTSYPPKRNVSVTIDGVRYMTYAEFGFARAKVVPLVAAPKILPAEP
jgi:hypothetical protein